MIKLYYCKIRNFGDSLSQALVHGLTGEQVSWGGAYAAEMSATGSILDTSFLFRSRPGIVSYDALKLLRRRINDCFSPRLRVWGSGFLTVNPVINPMCNRRLQICAVRGQLTRDVLKDYGVVKCDKQIACGDPGLFYSCLIEKMPEKKYSLGVVAHECDYLTGRFICEQLKKYGYSVKFIYAGCDNPHEVLCDIAKCERIISSSLHGCIVADSLGIPNGLMILSYFGRTRESHLFKYMDYYSAYGMELPAPLEINDFVCGTKAMETKIKNLAAVPMTLVRQTKQDLLDAFPYPIKEICKWI